MNERTLRLACFLGVFLVMALAEQWAPRRPRKLPVGRRWFANLGMMAIGSAALRLVFPAAAVGAAIWAEGRGIGLLNELPELRAAHVRESFPVLEGIFTVLVLDLLVFGQHWATHRFPLLWRLHRVHHADLEIDVSTGVRFHPLEILLSMALKCGAVVTLGAPPAGVLAFEVILNATSLFNHANLRLPAWLDRGLRLALVTPDMHRVHHSVLRRETDSCFGFCFPWWDRAFGTYVAVPERGQLGMKIGLPAYQKPEAIRLGWMLRLPFRRQ